MLLVDDNMSILFFLGGRTTRRTPTKPAEYAKKNQPKQQQHQNETEKRFSYPPTRG